LKIVFLSESVDSLIQAPTKMSLFSLSLKGTFGCRGRGRMADRLWRRG